MCVTDFAGAENFALQRSSSQVNTSPQQQHSCRFWIYTSYYFAEFVDYFLFYANFTKKLVVFINVFHSFFLGKRFQNSAITAADPCRSG